MQKTKDSRDGIIYRMKKKKRNHLQEIKAMAKAGGRDILPNVNLPRKKKTVRSQPRKRTTKNNMREKRLERQIIQSLRLSGYFVTKNGEQSTYNNPLIMSGMADIMVFTNRGVIFLEVKTEKGKQRDTQIKFEQMCTTLGVQYTIVRSVKEAHDACK